VKTHHASCPVAQAWDIPNVPCECPRFWPREERPTAMRVVTSVEAAMNRALNGHINWLRAGQPKEPSK
jgi:hypothetical protein